MVAKYQTGFDQPLLHTLYVDKRLAEIEKAFRNLYSFLSQVIPYQHSDLEKLFTYLRHLALKLPKRKSGPGCQFDEDVELDYYRLQKISESSINLSEGYAKPLDGPREVGTGMVREEQVPLVDDLAEYPRSSYPAYINQAKAESWLQRDDTYQLLGHQNKCAGYKSYVSQGIDEDLSKRYGRQHTVTVFGAPDFREFIAKERDKLKVNAELSAALFERPTAQEIVQAAAKVF